MGRLYIKTEPLHGKTVISDSFFSSPFKITKPFYNGTEAEIMIMQASAGILEGDNHALEFEIRSGSNVRIEGQSYTKLFRMNDGGAMQKTKITVESGAFLKYLPCPVIPFGNSSFYSKNEIHLCGGARFAMWDIFSCGRVGMGEKFEFSKYHSSTLIYEDERVVFADNTFLMPEDFNASGIGFFEGHTHIGLLYLYGYDDISPQSGLEIGITKARRGQAVRILADSGEDIMECMKNMI